MSAACSCSVQSKRLTFENKKLLSKTLQKENMFYSDYRHVDVFKFIILPYFIFYCRIHCKPMLSDMSSDWQPIYSFENLFSILTNLNVTLI
jgi:hypothetical protein